MDKNQEFITIVDEFTPIESAFDWGKESEEGESYWSNVYDRIHPVTKEILKLRPEDDNIII